MSMSDGDYNLHDARDGDGSEDGGSGEEADADQQAARLLLELASREGGSGKEGAGGEDAAGDGSVEEWEVIAGEAWEEVCFVCVVCVQCVCVGGVWCVRVLMCLESEHKLLST
jgi:hypothetical protein